MAKTHQQNNQAMFIDLTSVLSRPVADQNSEPMFNLDTDIPIEEAQFEQEPEPTETIQEPAPVSSSDHLSLSPDDIAIIAVNLIDGLQSFGFSLAKRKIMFRDEELEIINRLDHDKKTVYSQGSQEELAMKKWRKYMETIKKLPFDVNEKEKGN